MPEQSLGGLVLPALAGGGHSWAQAGPWKSQQAQCDPAAWMGTEGPVMSEPLGGSSLRKRCSCCD